MSYTHRTASPIIFPSWEKTTRGKPPGISNSAAVIAVACQQVSALASWQVCEKQDLSLDVLVARQHQCLSRCRDVDVVMTRTRGALRHRRQQLRDLCGLGMIEPPHHAILVQLDVGGARLNQEVVNRPAALQLRRALLLRTNQRRQKSRYPIGVHDQQHRVVAKVKLPGQFGANDCHTSHAFLRPKGLAIDGSGFESPSYTHRNQPVTASPTAGIPSVFVTADSALLIGFRLS